MFKISFRKDDDISLIPIFVNALIRDRAAPAGLVSNARELRRSRRCDSGCRTVEELADVEPDRVVLAEEGREVA